MTQHLFTIKVATVLLAIIFAFPAARATDMPKALLIIGNGKHLNHDHDPHYPPWHHAFHTDDIERILKGIVNLTVTDELSVLNDRELKQYDLIMNNSMLMMPTKQQMDAFYRFIDSGKSYLAMHSGLMSFLNSERYETLMGARFVGGSAQEPERFTVYTHDAWWGYDYGFSQQQEHPITRGVRDFVIEDELYLMQTNTADLEVLARAENHPVMWLRPWGKGTVMALTLGHGLSGIDNPGYRALLQNGVRWLVDYPLLDSIPDGLFAPSAAPVDDYVDLDEMGHHPRNARLTYRLTGNSDSELVSATIDDDNRLRLAFAPGREGMATLRVEARDPAGLTVATTFSVTLQERSKGNLALYHDATATASSSESRKTTADPRFAIDGNRQTRWSSAFEDPSWLAVDLGGPQTVNQVRLHWEPAFGRRYEIQVSDNGEQWQSVYTQIDGDGGTDVVTFDPVETRFVRLYGTQRASEWGYSLYEFEVFHSPQGGKVQ